jgi:2,3-bisphosphoglycerate-dependent phosphoglycerate mutase
MSFLILVRHGQSIWNLEKRFTGWVDVDLSEKGVLEAENAGLLIKKENIKIDFYYSSLQLRANKTLKIIQKVLGDNKNFIRAWQLNERNYGALTGLNKIETAQKIGDDKVHEFRRSWNIKPEALSKDSPYHALNIETYKNVPLELIPDTESLEDTYRRVLRYFEDEIKEKIKNKNILISAHGNSIRALCKNLF